MKPLKNCSTKVCFLFQFFWVLGFVLVSGFLFVLLILGLEGCGLWVFIFVHIALFLVGSLVSRFVSVNGFFLFYLF